MIISCPNCTTRLQLDDTKVPARTFTVRCPKCRQIINAQPDGTSQASASAVVASVSSGGDLPATTHTQRTPAPAYRRAPEDEEPKTMPAEPQAEAEASVAEAEVARLLAALLGRGTVETALKPESAKRRTGWDARRALVCVSTSHRDGIAKALARDHYEVYVADDTGQAIERMREDKMDVLVLDTEFDIAEQGAAFLTRELNSLRLSERRRMVVVQLSPSARTEDAHAAFLANVNLVVNAGEVHNFSRALERTIRDLNELYKDFNVALGVADL